MDNTDVYATKIEEFIEIRDAETGEVVLSRRGVIVANTEKSDDE